MKKTGLVLSGGGAKGAYQVGIIKYLAENNIEIDVVSGASIGSLNGALIAGSKDLNEAYNKMYEIWTELKETSVLNLKTTTKIKIVLYILIKIFGKAILKHPAFQIINLIDSISNKEKGIIDNNENEKLINKYIDFDYIKYGKPLYASIYETEGNIMDSFKYLFNVTHSSEYLKIQDFNEKEEMLKLLLASSSLPFLFDSQKINDKNYKDGGLGDARSSLGNTPIAPLIEKEHCDLVIVSHLSDASLWDRHKYPDTEIIEIRPQDDFISHHLFTDLISFNKKDINIWINQGYNDSKLILDKVFKFVNRKDNLVHSMKTTRESIKKLQNIDLKLF